MGEMPPSAPKPWVTSSHTLQETLFLAYSPPAPGGSCLSPQQSPGTDPGKYPKKPCWVPARAYP